MSAAEAAEAAETRPQRWRFQALESWRGILALSVVLFHFNAASHLHDFFHNAFVAVDFFFVLSGFVIASVYQDRIDSALELGKYVLRRVGRLYPLHLFVLGVYVLFELSQGWLGIRAPFGGDKTVATLPWQLGLTHAFLPQHEDWNYPSWTISLEFWVNILIGFVILFARKATPLWIAILAVGLIGFFWTPYFIDYGAQSDVMANLANDADYAIGFLGGMLTFNLFRLMHRHGWTLFWGLDILALGLTLWVFRMGLDAPPLSKAAIFCVVVLIFAFEKGWVSRLLRHRFALRLGVLSYSIYLTHSLYVWAFTDALDAVALRTGQTLGVPEGEGNLLVIGGPWVLDALSVLILVAVVLGSELTYRFVEDPARRLFNRMAGARPSPA